MKHHMLLPMHILTIFHLTATHPRQDPSRTMTKIFHSSDGSNQSYIIVSKASFRRKAEMGKKSAHVIVNLPQKKKVIRKTNGYCINERVDTKNI